MSERAKSILTEISILSDSLAVLSTNKMHSMLGKLESRGPEMGRETRESLLLTF